MPSLFLFGELVLTNQVVKGLTMSPYPWPPRERRKSPYHGGYVEYLTNPRKENPLPIEEEDGKLSKPYRSQYLRSTLLRPAGHTSKSGFQALRS